MKRRIVPFLILALALLLTTRSALADPLGAAFTYQGQLKRGGASFTGTCAMQFSLFDAASGGIQIGSTLTQNSVTVSGSLFTTTLDFGTGIFTGNTRYLEIAVRCGSDTGYTTLSPRQQLTAVPYALYALNAPSSGSSWTLLGNSGTTASSNFVGTTDNVNLVLRANNVIGWRLVPQGGDTPNVVGGLAGNGVTAGVKGGTIAGGGVGGDTNRVTDDYGVVSGGTANVAGDDSAPTDGATSATVGGGTLNTAGAIYATVSGGASNSATQDAAVVGGGFLNTASSGQATVSGGNANTAGGSQATVGGGNSNTAGGTRATVSGGSSNTAGGAAAAIPGGDSNAAAGDYALVAGRRAKNSNAAHDGVLLFADSTDKDFSSTTANQLRARVTGGVSLVTTIDSTTGADLGGWRIEPNSTNTPNFVGGYSGNDITGGVMGGIIAAGGDVTGVNRVTDNFGTVSGGRGNRAGNESGTTADRLYATVAGGTDNTAAGTAGVVGGGAENSADGTSSTIAGGESNLVTDNYGTIGGGLNNQAGDGGSTTNKVYATVGGGSTNTASGARSTIAGGDTNTASGNYSSVGGGENNQATFSFATVAGGSNNIASGTNATVSGGSNNTAAGAYSQVGGYRAKNSNNGHDGVFLFADSQDFDFSSKTQNQFRVRATGGVQFVTGIDGTGADAAGVQVASGSGTWSSISDRNAKQNFSPIDAREILRRVADMPVFKWNYKTQDASIRHIGPMAQDFYSAFGVGEDEKYITNVDADGVALAAIQGLNEIVKQQQATLDAQQQEITQLHAQQAAMNGTAVGQIDPPLLGGMLLAGMLLGGGLVMGAVRYGMYAAQKENRT